MAFLKKKKGANQITTSTTNSAPYSPTSEDFSRKTQLFGRKTQLIDLFIHGINVKKLNVF